MVQAYLMRSACFIDMNFEAVNAHYCIDIAELLADVEEVTKTCFLGLEVFAVVFIGFYFKWNALFDAYIRVAKSLDFIRIICQQVDAFYTQIFKNIDGFLIFSVINMDCLNP